MSNHASGSGNIGMNKVIIPNVITHEECESVNNYAMWRWTMSDGNFCRKTADIPSYFDGRFGVPNSNPVIPKSMFDRFDLIAKQHFSPTALPTYTKWIKYSPRFGVSVLPPHVDDNACTYTIDVQLKSSVAWPIYISGEPYLLDDLSAVVYNGVDELHWRYKFPSRNANDFCTIIVAHYAEPDHWFFDERKRLIDNPIYNLQYHREYKEREQVLMKQYEEMLRNYPNE